MRSRLLPETLKGAAISAARGFEKAARVYLQDVRRGRLGWEAGGKARRRSQEDTAAGPTAQWARVERLDLAPAIKVSQAVSAELVLELMADNCGRPQTTPAARLSNSRCWLIPDIHDPERAGPHSVRRERRRVRSLLSHGEERLNQGAMDVTS